MNFQKRDKIKLDENWKFYYGDIPIHETFWGRMKNKNCNQGAIKANYDDSNWRLVDLPHDFVVEGYVSPSYEGFEENHGVPAMSTVNNFPTTRGSLNGAVAWYRKKIFIPETDLGKRFYIEFEGVYRDCDVYLNESYIGSQKSGYAGFWFDISEFIEFGEENVLVIRVDATGGEGWWYEGGGIYRHVWLYKTEAIHIPMWSTSIKTKLSDHNTKASVEIITKVSNKSGKIRNCVIKTMIYDGNESAVASSEAQTEVTIWGTKSITQTIEIENPVLWDLKNPYLYHVYIQIADEEDVYDDDIITFGIRECYFDPERGFILNGEQVKLKGLCCHQDHAGLGIALPDGLIEYRIEKLKEIGCNAYRSSHHPASPMLLEICDRLGMLVLSENRVLSTSNESMMQLESMIVRDRNHPCIIAWCIGNEETGIHRHDRGKRTARALREFCRSLDGTRQVTLAISMWDHDISDHFQPSEILGTALELDVMGFNYAHFNWEKFRILAPELPAVVTEASSGMRTRGIYEHDEVRCHMTGFKDSKQDFDDIISQWELVVKHDWIAGLFLWTGFDYRGEPSPFAWPAVISQFGLMDLCGFPKDHYYYYKSWWAEETVLYIFPHWNWPDRIGLPIDVWCFSNCETVEMFLNGKSLGRKNVTRNGYLVWEHVIYEIGEIVAVGVKNGLEVMDVRKTIQLPYSLKLEPHKNTMKPDGEDVTVINVSVIDEDGYVIPVADHEIKFRIEGCGKIIGVGNGNPSSHEWDKSTVRRCFNGKCQVIVKSIKKEGEVKLIAKTQLLMQSEIIVKVKS